MVHLINDLNNRLIKIQFIMILLFLSLIGLSGCEIKENPIELQFPLDTWSSYTSSYPGLPMEISFYKENLNINLSVDGGQFIKSEDHIEIIGKEVTLSQPGTIYWRNIGLDSIIYSSRNVYIKMVVYENDVIIGYAIINFYSYSEMGMVENTYKSKILESVIFSNKQKNTIEEINIKLDEIVSFHKFYHRYILNEDITDVMKTLKDKGHLFETISINKIEWKFINSIIEDSKVDYEKIYKTDLGYFIKCKNVSDAKELFKNCFAGTVATNYQTFMCENYVIITYCINIIDEIK